MLNAGDNVIGLTIIILPTKKFPLYLLQNVRNFCQLLTHYDTLNFRPPYNHFVMQELKGSRCFWHTYVHFAVKIAQFNHFSIISHDTDNSLLMQVSKKLKFSQLSSLCCELSLVLLYKVEANFAKLDINIFHNIEVSSAIKIKLAC